MRQLYPDISGNLVRVEALCSHFEQYPSLGYSGIIVMIAIVQQNACQTIKKIPFSVTLIGSDSVELRPQMLEPWELARSQCFNACVLDHADNRHLSEVKRLG